MKATATLCPNAILALVMALPFLLLPVPAAAVEGLLTKTDMTYLGAFRLPQGTFGGSRFGYGGHGPAPYHDPATGRYTLFLEGHAWYPGYVAQVEIPKSTVISGNWDELPQATVLQEFNDIGDGKWDTLSDYMFYVYGMLVHDGRLIVGASEYYDADYTQTASHGVSGLNLSRNDDFQGFFPMTAAATPRSLGGFMTPVPPQWQSALGGPALTGNCCLPIISASSSGPSVTSFDPDHVGAVNPIPGTTLIFYPLAHPMANGTTQNNLFNNATQMGGMAFPSGTRSVLFIGRQGTGPYCYGCGIDPEGTCPADCHGECCVDPCDHSKGTHSHPYQHQVWAYDANDLVAVKNGEKATWEPRPYAVWTLDDMDTSGCADIRGAGYDHLTRRLYITQGYGESPRVDVYKVGGRGDTTPPLLAIDPESTPTNATSRTVTGTTEAGANVEVATDTTASDGFAAVTGDSWSYTISGLAWGANNLTVTAWDQAGNNMVRTASVTRSPALSITLTGTGGGNVVSAPGGILCPSGGCSNFFPYTSTVSLTAFPDGDSLFTGWSVCSGTGGCGVVMNGDRAVSAEFTFVQPARIPGTPPSYHPTLTEAYGALTDGGNIQARAFLFTEELNLNHPVPVRLTGGYDTSFTTITGRTAVRGSVTVKLGALEAENLEIR